MIASIVLPALFIASGLFAFTTIVMAWRAHAGEVMALRAQLAASREFNDYRVRLALTETHEYLPVARRSLFRRPAPQRQPRQQRSGRHAAA
ncbi:hypothetical protein H7F51_05030 [Novosphingobium flavum]|uniref:Uncharacterized protein n=1 Tax=Novosphingobium flavum TaxID=1778672 RepID=A0A7X1KL52_9SPHN|nr:hypothetical protein [Novosphingobium flavum]MBC2664875.1 hypothetical protein [Novosphingobium flavum]